MFFGKKETLLIMSMSIMIAGCAYIKKDLVQAPCVIGTSVSFNTDIVPIIRQNCNTCHSTGSNVSGILLETYDEVKPWALNGFLYGTISQASGYPAMPQGSVKLDDCTIATIKNWIDNGAPNN
jgi:hypothetical protein